MRLIAMNMRLLCARIASAACAAVFLVLAMHPAPASAHTRITTNITWSGDVRALLRQHCMRCHSPGGIAPSYADFTIYGTDSKPGARAWATAIEEEILTGRMPPWDADARYGAFGNARRLTKKEVDTIVAWVQGGAPQGPRRNLPTPSEFSGDGWLLGAPELLVQPPQAFTLEGGQMTGEVKHQIELSLERDTWITGYEFRADNPGAVYRMEAWLVDPENAEPESLEVEVQVPYDPFRDEDEPEATRKYLMKQGRRFLGQWLRGDAPVLLPEGAGKRIRVGSTVELAIEYRRSDSEDRQSEIQDLSELGLFLAQTEDEVDLIASAKSFGQIVKVQSPKLRSSNKGVKKKKRGRGAKESASAPSSATVSMTLAENVRLVGLNPRIGDSVQSLEVRAAYPDDRTRTLLWIPQYRSEWPASFFFEEPLDAPNGTRLEMLATFDEEAAGSDQRLELVVDYTLDDHLVLPEVFAPQDPAERPKGGMLLAGLGDGLDNGLGAAGADAASADPANPNAAAHMDHSPLHGGQFFMAPKMYHHLEGALPKEGEFYLYVYDDFKKPLDPRNFSGQVIFERYDDKTGDFAEEVYELEALPGTQALKASISPEMPAEFFASVWLAGVQRRFDFYFLELSKEPPPSARPSPSYANTDHSHERPPLTIPADAAGIVQALVGRTNQLGQKIESGDWLKLYVPAFDGRDLAEALLEELDGLTARDRGRVRKAVSRVMQSAGELDRAGDLVDQARARIALDRFSDGVRVMVEAIIGR